MKCANCRCEIGNLTTCPYCGMPVQRYQYRQSTQSVRTNPVRTQPVHTQMTANSYGGRRARRDTEHDLWGLIHTVLLVGLIVLELLQLIALLL